jgi:porin
MVRLYGSWDVVGRDTPDTGGLIYKVEHRHRYTDVAPTGFASELGYVGLLNPAYSNQGWRLTNLYWRQRLFDNHLVIYAGFLDATDYVDVYALASPWTGFNNFVFSTGSATIGLPNDATLGVAAGFWIPDNFYVIAGITDANADPTDPFEGFNTFFNDFETFTSLEVGWTSSREELLLNKVHATLWHIDARQVGREPLRLDLDRRDVVSVHPGRMGRERGEPAGRFRQRRLRLPAGAGRRRPGGRAQLGQAQP